MHPGMHRYGRIKVQWFRIGFGKCRKIYLVFVDLAIVKIRIISSDPADIDPGKVIIPFVYRQ